MPGPFTLAQIANRLGGRVAGQQEVLIQQVGSLERAGPGQITFLSNSRFRAQLAGTGASAVVLGADAEGLTGLPRIVCGDPYSYFARVSQLFNPRITQAAGVHPSANVAPSAKLGERVSIGPGCAVGEGVILGDDSCLYPNVVVYPGCRIGAGALILGHLSICDHAHVSADTVISRSILKPGTYTGMFPADDHESWARNTAVVRQLADLLDRVRSLEKRIPKKEQDDG